jgi:hypothetical protein
MTASGEACRQADEIDAWFTPRLDHTRAASAFMALEPCSSLDIT